MVAVIGHEPDWRECADTFDEHDRLLWSAMSRWEAVVVLSRRLRTSIADTQRVVDDFAATNRLEFIPIGRLEADAALDAFEQYGKGSRHPAQLNMGDCFAYACAKTNNAHLLYKGDDFSHTDLAK